MSPAHRIPGFCGSGTPAGLSQARVRHDAEVNGEAARLIRPAKWRSLYDGRVKGLDDGAPPRDEMNARYIHVGGCVYDVTEWGWILRR